MIEINCLDGRGFARLRDANLDRVALEGKQQNMSFVRLTFSDSKTNYVQVDLEISEFYKMREWLNRRKDI